MMLVMAFAVQGQDIHFSQVDADPMLLNPAYAGFYQGAGRFGMLYRNQWATVSIPYQTFAFSGEVALWRSRNMNSGLSAGVSLFNDHAGTLHYGTTSGHLSLAYYRAVNRAATSYLSFVAAGVAWYWQPTGDFHTKVGVSVRNINRPNISYMQLDSVFLHRRFSLFARAEYRYWNAVSVLPVFLCQFQGRHREWIYGADLKWYIEEGGARQVSLRAGVAMRHLDAVIASLMVEFNAFLFTFCYDANISGLSVASGSFGAIEAGVVYRLNQGSRKTKAIKCPVY